MAAVAAALPAPAAALAHGRHHHDRAGHDGRHHHHHGYGWRAAASWHHHHGWRAYLLKGTAQSVDASAGTVTIAVQKASRGGRDLVGSTVTLQATRFAVADTNGDGRRTLDDIATGDRIVAWVKRFRRDGGTTLKARALIDKTSLDAHSKDRGCDGGDRDDD